jgi:Secreted repeat of unknown function
MFSVITCTDGTKQLAVNGKPLYTFASDTKPGDVKGQGVKRLPCCAIERHEVLTRARRPASCATTELPS